MKAQEKDVDWVSSQGKQPSRHQRKTSHIARSQKGSRHQTNPKKRDNPQMCYRCGHKTHKNKKDCPAYRQQCNKCGKPNHFAKMCKTNTDRKVHVVNENSYSDSSSEEEFYVHTVSGFSKSRSDQAQTVD